MPRLLGRWLSSVLAIAAGCGGNLPEKSGDRDKNATVTSLSDDAFGRPWAFYDSLGPERPIDVLLAIPGGFVAITHQPSPDPRSNPNRNNIAATSADGVTWVEQPLGASVHARALARGNGVVVAVGQRLGAGSRGTILTSNDDGKTWTEQPGPDVGLQSVDFVEGQFWAFGEAGAFLTSRDGRSWENHSRREYVQLNDIAFGLGRYVIVGNVSWLSSADGRTFTEHRTICDDITLCPGVVPPGGAPPGALALFSVLFGNGTFVTEGWVSTDGLRWSAAPGATGAGVFTHGRFIATTRDGAVMVSTDGRSWTRRTTTITTDDRTLSCTGRTCIALPQGLLVVPAPADPLPLPRLPPLELDEQAGGTTVAAKVGQSIQIFLQTAGSGEYGTPVISSPAVRFIESHAVGGPPPLPPIRTRQRFRFSADAAGQADLRIPHTGSTPEFRLTIDVTTR